MVPTYFGGMNVDGSYWTLRLEICFYALIFVVILIGASAHLERFFLMWPLIILAAQFTSWGTATLLSCYAAYFAAGALFAMRLTTSNWLIKVLLLLCYFESLYWSSILTNPFDTGNKVMLVLITSFYMFFYFLNNPGLLRLRLPAARLVGALTYPLYLIHQAIGYVIIRTFATPANKVAVTLGTMGIMLLVAYLLHRVVEVNGKEISKRLINTFVTLPLAFIEAMIRPSGSRRDTKTISPMPILNDEAK
jgi:peptidoglycan/LPS O-acetylase OafA/YrhL